MHTVSIIFSQFFQKMESTRQKYIDLEMESKYMGVLVKKES